MMWKSYRVLLLKAVIHLTTLTLLVSQYYLAFTDQLGADPVKAIIHFTGIGAFNLLLLTLAVTPCAKLFKLSFLMQVRRLLGLYSFAYAVFHLLSFLAFEVQFDFALFIDEIIKRPYITIGMTAFVILLALAFTSFKALQRNMGKRWQQLHNWVYVAVILVGIHFYWSVKSDITEPSIYFFLIGVLFWLRKDKLQKLFSS